MSEELARGMLDPAGYIVAVSDQQPCQRGYLTIEADGGREHFSQA